MGLLNTARQSGDPVYYDADFLKVVADHKSFFRNTNNSRYIGITDEEKFMFKNNIRGLLAYLGVPDELILICMIVNEVDSPMATVDNSKGFYFPDPSLIGQLLNSHKAA